MSDCSSGAAGICFGCASRLSMSVAEQADRTVLRHAQTKARRHRHRRPQQSVWQADHAPMLVQPYSAPSIPSWSYTGGSMGGAEEINAPTGMVRCLEWAIDGRALSAMTGERYDIRTRTGMPAGCRDERVVRRQKSPTGRQWRPCGTGVARSRQAVGGVVGLKQECFYQKHQRWRSGVAADSADVTATNRLPGPSALTAKCSLFDTSQANDCVRLNGNSTGCDCRLVIVRGLPA